jgi:hypothetical protein
MSTFFKNGLGAVMRFLADKSKRRFLYLCLLCIAAFSEFLILGLVRRTFVFYSINTGMPVVEDRMLSRTKSRELDIRRYVEEALLGPVALDTALLFLKETRLRSLMYRDGVVYADLSESAAIPVPEGGDVFNSLYTLYQGIRRNFSYVKDVYLFIGGNEVYGEKFREIFDGISEK